MDLLQDLSEKEKRVVMVVMEALALLRKAGLKVSVSWLYGTTQLAIMVDRDSLDEPEIDIKSEN